MKSCGCSETTKDKYNKLSELAQELYRESGRTFIPMYPWVFVYVLEREQQVGRVIVPDSKQNKPVHEGIVLATWKPFCQTKEERYKAVEPLVTRIPVESDLKPGDHVIFPHWAGMPIHGFNDLHYRVVKEREWAKDKEGGIMAVLEYEDRPEKIIKEYLLGTSEMASFLQPLWIDDVVARIKDRFLLVDRKQGSRTLSGK